MPTFFGRELLTVGRLPSLPIFVDYSVLADHATAHVTRTWERDLPSGKEVSDLRPPSGREGVSADWIGFYTQTFPEPVTPRRPTVKANVQDLLSVFDELENGDEFEGFLRVCGPFRHELPDERWDRYWTESGVGASQTSTWMAAQKWQTFFREWRLKGCPTTFELREANSENMDFLDAVLYSPNGGLFKGEANWQISKKHPTGKMASTAFIYCATALEAMAATIVVGFEEKTQWRECAYEHCRGHKLFRLKRASSDQRFCSVRCKEAAKQQRTRGSKKAVFQHGAT